MLHNPMKVEIREFSQSDEGKMIFVVDNLHIYNLDEVAADTLAACDGRDRSEIIADVQRCHPPDEVEETLEQLEKVGLIREKDANMPPFVPPDSYPITVLDLHVCHVCNLRCRYCYSGEGDYGMGKKFMSKEVARASIEFLMERSGKMDNPRVVLFGGEPLMNFDLIRYIVDDCSDIPKKYNKKIEFSMTTNGTLLEDNVIEYLNSRNIHVLVSIDGDRETHDRMRIFADGSGSYDVMLPKIQKLLKSRKGRVSARTTYSKYNLDLVGIAEHLTGLGFGNVYLSGCWMDGSSDYELTKADVPRLREEFGRMREYLLHKIKNREYRWASSMLQKKIMTVHTPQPRLYPCGAGKNYLAVTPDGDLYFCHRFAGNDRFKFGNVFTGLDLNMQKMILDSHVYFKEDCSRCWIRHLCAGGCWYINFMGTEDINMHSKYLCDISRNETESLLELYSKLQTEDRELIAQLFPTADRPYDE